MSIGIREASRLCGKSEKTIRKYIAGNKLAYEKINGKFGPEYVLTVEGLRMAGLLGEGTPTMEVVEPLESEPDEPEDDTHNELLNIPKDQLIAKLYEQQSQIETLQDSMGTIRLALEQQNENHKRELAAKDSYLEDVKAERARILEELRQARAEVSTAKEDVTEWVRKATSLETKISLIEHKRPWWKIWG